MTAPVNEGEWRWVPLEPTPEMVESAGLAKAFPGDTGRFLVAEVYRAMLSAAPSRPEQDAREAVAEALWRAEAAVTQASARARSVENWADQSDAVKDKWRRYADAALSAMPAPAAPDETEALREEVERLRNEVKYFREREQHFVKVLGIPDGGRYRNDWDAYLKGVLTRNKALEEECRLSMHTISDERTRFEVRIKTLEAMVRRLRPWVKWAHVPPADPSSTLSLVAEIDALLANNGGADE